MFLEGSSWQERYGANEVFLLRCRMVDRPGILGKLTSVIGECGVHVGSVELVEVDENTQIRDILIFCKSKDVVASTVDRINETDDMEVVEAVDQVMEIHRRGAIDVVSRMPIESLTDLRMVYTPGVASVCKEIERNPDSAWEWTGLCDRVAIITNGTAVLGLGDIGVVPSLPVMEGKAAIFAEFANLSAIPILVDSKDPQEVIETTLKIAPSFGAIQLEDVAAPACFEIEEALRDKLNVPVFHDDQHGTATVVLAALINAVKTTGKKVEDCNVIMLGAGAAGIAISKILLDFGVNDIVVYDSTGPIYKGRTERMTKYKEQLASITNKQGQTSPLAEGFKDKDIFIGVAQPNMVSKDMIASMNEDPICFPLSNPVGEISPEEAIKAGAAVVADGRGVNNALAYPGIFRGALDVRATAITLDMQVAAAKKLAEIADEDCLLPDMLDRNVHRQVADAVAAEWLKKSNS